MISTFRRDSPPALLLVFLLAFLLASTQSASARPCADPDQGRHLPPDLTDARPPIRLNVYVSPAPTLAEATTVLMLATFAARQEQRRPPVILRVFDRNAPLSEANLESSIVVDAAEATAIDSHEGERPRGGPSDRWTFDDLGYPLLEVRGVRETTQTIALSQANLGGPIADALLHLVGTHSTLAPGATAELSVLLNGGLIHSAPLHQPERFEVSIRLPRSLLRRDNTVTLRVIHAPSRDAPTGGGGAFALQFDPASHLAVSHGQTLAPGFDRFPQVLLPSFHVSFDRLTPAGLQSAAQVVAALQSLTRARLSPRVVAWSEALVSSEPLIAVALDPRSARALEPPLTPGAFRLRDGFGREVLHFGADSRFAVMQAFAARGRDILLITHTNWPEGVIPLASELAAGTSWYGLSGDLWITASDRRPFSLRLRGSGLVVESIPAHRWVWWEAGRHPVFLGATLLVMAFLLWSRPRLVRSEPRRLTR